MVDLSILPNIEAKLEKQILDIGISTVKERIHLTVL
jgi:hypothetical protein